MHVPLHTLPEHETATKPCAHWQLVPMHIALAGQYALPPHETASKVWVVPHPAGGVSPPPLLLPLPPLPPPLVEQLPLLVQPLAIGFMLQQTSVRPF